MNIVFSFFLLFFPSTTDCMATYIICYAIVSNGVESIKFITNHVFVSFGFSSYFSILCLNHFKNQTKKKSRNSFLMRIHQFVLLKIDAVNSLTRYFFSIFFFFARFEYICLLAMQSRWEPMLQWFTHILHILE